MSEYRTFVVPYDFSVHARAALYTAVDLARRLGATVHLVHVIQPPHYAYGYGTYAGAVVASPFDMNEVFEGASRALQEIAETSGGQEMKLETHVTQGAGIADAIRDTAQELGADLIVMGTHGRTGLAHVFLGSVAERTLRLAPCAVLTVQAPEEEEREGGESSGASS